MTFGVAFVLIRRERGYGICIEYVNQFWILWLKLTEKFWINTMISVIKTKSTMSRRKWNVSRNFYVSLFSSSHFQEFLLDRHSLFKIEYLVIFLYNITLFWYITFFFRYLNFFSRISTSYLTLYYLPCAARITTFTGRCYIVLSKYHKIY